MAAAFGVGMIGASVALSVVAARPPGAFWLIGGVITGDAGAALSGLAPDIAVGCAGQVIGGIGNSADLSFAGVGALASLPLLFPILPRTQDPGSPLAEAAL